MNRFIEKSFQVQNIFVDKIMNEISDSACKIYLIMCRKIRGWRKEKDSISLSQLEKISGKSRPTVIKAKNELLKVGLIIEMPSTRYGHTYKLGDAECLGLMMIFLSKKHQNTEVVLKMLVRKFDYTSENFSPSLVKKIYSQNITSKKHYTNKNNNKKDANSSDIKLSETLISFDLTSVPLPSNVKNSLWIQYVEMRISIKKPLTKNGAKLLINKLETFNDQANQALETAIIGNYQNIFLPRKELSNQSVQQPPKRRNFGKSNNENNNIRTL